MRFEKHHFEKELFDLLTSQKQDTLIIDQPYQGFSNFFVLRPPFEKIFLCDPIMGTFALMTLKRYFPLQITSQMFVY